MSTLFKFVYSGQYLTTEEHKDSIVRKSHCVMSDSQLIVEFDVAYTCFSLCLHTGV